MGIKNQYGMTDLQCEICGHHFVDETGNSYDEARLATVRARELGWTLTKRRGKWQALCPECTSATGYSLGPEALP